MADYTGQAFNFSMTMKDQISKSVKSAQTSVEKMTEAIAKSEKQQRSSVDKYKLLTYVIKKKTQALIEEKASIEDAARKDREAGVVRTSSSKSLFDAIKNHALAVKDFVSETFDKVGESYNKLKDNVSNFVANPISRETTDSAVSFYKTLNNVNKKLQMSRDELSGFFRPSGK